MKEQLYYIVIIIVSSGIIGGMTNYVKSENKSLLKNLLTSIIACGIVPLFLHLVSSRLVIDIMNGINTEENNLLANYLLFLGYCLIASFSADSFMEMISAKVINQKLKEEKATAVKEKNKALEEVDQLRNDGKALISSLDIDAMKNIKFREINNEVNEKMSDSYSEDDPQKGKWGGGSIKNNRELKAEVSESSLLPEFYNIHLEVVSTNPQEPLKGQVIFHLHPTFVDPVRIVPVENGKAELDLLAYGSFTVGVECDNKNTQLELDLSELEGVSQTFRER